MLRLALGLVGVELLAKKNEPIGLEGVSLLLLFDYFTLDMDLVFALAFVADVVFRSESRI